MISSKICNASAKLFLKVVMTRWKIRKTNLPIIILVHFLCCIWKISAKIPFSCTIWVSQVMRVPFQISLSLIIDSNKRKWPFYKKNSERIRTKFWLSCCWRFKSAFFWKPNIRFFLGANIYVAKLQSDFFATLLKRFFMQILMHILKNWWNKKIAEI